MRSTPPEEAISADLVQRTRDGIRDFLLQTLDVTRPDRLWPSHYLAFMTNPLSAAYGAVGPAVFLYRCCGELPRGVRKWILDRDVSASDYPPGLLLGTAGIAYSLGEIGLEQRALDVMRTTYNSPLLFEEPTMFLGCAGWGLASQYCYDRFGDQRYLDMVDVAATHLTECAVDDQSGCHWSTHLGNRVNYGYGYGASGIALFLAVASRTTNQPAFAAVARRAIHFDLQGRIETPLGWAWGEYEGGSRNLPYWGHGSAGIGAAAVRLALLFEDGELLDTARTVAAGLDMKATGLPCQINGFAGIGELFLDLFIATGERSYFASALDIVAAILPIALQRDDGIAIPGRWLTRISNDFATGSAGVGMFLHRLLTLSERYLVDLAGPLRPASCEADIHAASSAP